MEARGVRAKGPERWGPVKRKERAAGKETELRPRVGIGMRLMDRFCV